VKTIQVRNVPERVYCVLRARAARAGMSLSDFIKRQLAWSAERPTMQEWLARTGQVMPFQSKRSAAQVIRELRDAG
jgi:plasmid stability protein